jgi:hypothetical protein
MDYPDDWSGIPPHLKSFLEELGYGGIHDKETASAVHVG